LSDSKKLFVREHRTLRDANKFLAQRRNQGQRFSLAMIRIKTNNMLFFRVQSFNYRIEFIQNML